MGAGFTLFEVMAAVAVLGFAVAVLARGAIQGMQYEGDASRRLTASLIADGLLWQEEAKVRLGAPLTEDHREGQDPTEEFHWVVDVRLLDPAALGPLFAPEAAASASSAAAAPPGAPGASAAIPLLEVNVRVAWLEGVAEQAVTRTTFAYDPAAAAEVLGALEQAQGGAAATGAEATGEPGRRARPGPRRPAEAGESPEEEE